MMFKLNVSQCSCRNPFLTQSQLAAKEKELRDARSALCSLREDFAYNLKLMEERDAELTHYDAVYAQASGRRAERCDASHLTTIGFCWRVVIADPVTT